MKHITKVLVMLLSVIGTFGLGKVQAQSITATPDTLCFGCVLIASTSPVQSALVSGSYLTPASGTLTVTAPANYEVCATASGTFVSSYTIAYSGGFLPPVPVAVRFIAPASVGTYSGNVAISGGGASTRNIMVIGTSVSSVGGSCMCTGTPAPGHIVATDTSGCTTYSSTLTLDGYCLTAGTTYQWQSSTTSGGTYTNISGATNTSFTLTVPYSFYLKCVVTCASSGMSATTTPIHLAYGTPPSVYPIVGAATVALYGSTPLADATGGGTWSSSSPSVASVTASGMVFGVSAGTATISYSVTDSCGTTLVTKTITVTSSLSESNVVGSHTGLTATLAPNPATNVTEIACTMNGEGNVHIRILDVTGAALRTHTAYINQSGTFKLNLDGLAAGVYMVELTGNGEKLVKMLVKN